MNNSRNNRWIVEVISALFILLFLYTSLNKLFTQRLFQFVLSKSPLLGGWAEVLSYSVPIAEIIVSVLLLIHRTRQIGLYLSLILMSAFTIYIAYMIAFTPKLPCSCGGVLQYLSWKQHLLFNLCFVTLAMIALSMAKQQKAVYTNRRSRKPA